MTLGGYTVVYDGVIGPWFLEPFGEAAALDCLHYVLLLPPEQGCVERFGLMLDTALRISTPPGR